MAKAEEKGQKQVFANRRPAVLLSLFFVIFSLQVVATLLGYRYLDLASEYTSRNLIHLDAVTDARIEIERAQIGVDKPVARLTELITLAKAQVDWCLEQLGPVERYLFVSIGAAPALQICEDDIVRAQFGLELLEKMANPPSGNVPLTERPFALQAQFSETLRLMLEDSRAFAPLVVALREKLTFIVQAGTAGIGFCMLLFFAVLSKAFLSNWRSLAVQSREVQRQSDRFKLAMQSNVDGLALFDLNMQLLSYNENFVRLLLPADMPMQRQPLEELLQAALDAKSIVNFDGDTHALMEKITEAMHQAQVSGFPVELSDDRHAYLTLAKTGFGDTLMLVKDTTLHVRSVREKEAHASEMQMVNAQIERASRLDPLTNLANRRALDEALHNRPKHQVTTVVRIDLDRFKQVNDVFGHEAGDYVLTHVSDILRHHCRGDDMPVRVGGDEFLILCSPGTTEKKAAALSHRLLKKMQEPVIYDGRQLLFGASFGVASTAGVDSDPDSLLRSADAALYLAKNSGRSTVRLFTPDLNEAVNRDRALAEAFLPALKEGQFKVFAQTIHAADDWSFAGVEVLARWQHPEFGLLSPDKFLPIAKQLGVEADLDATIFATALDEMYEIEKTGFYFPRISFNVSAGRLLDPQFSEAVKESKSHWDKRIAFEILETISLEEGSDVLNQIQRLKKAGFEIDVDDFGSDHASLNSVLEIGPSTVKIDRKIITPLGAEQSAEIMVKSIVQMGKAMGVAITAEGIENEQQAELVKKLGGDRLQGYFFSKPQPLRDVVAHMSGWQARPLTAKAS